MNAPVDFELLPRDLAPCREGNAGIPYVHRFMSGRPGPHVLVNALTHGNEICGMVAATDLLDRGARPCIGTPTVSFANVEAYESSDRARPVESRQLVHNLNRVGSTARLEGSEDSPELRRARELRPVVAAADHILDLHSTSGDVQPFRRYPHFERKRASGEMARHVTWRFLAHFGLVGRDDRDEGGGGDDEVFPQPAPPPRRYELLRTHVIKDESFTFARPLEGFETFAAGELIATDGEEEIRAPCDACTMMTAARRAIVGREGACLTRPLG